MRGKYLRDAQDRYTGEANRRRYATLEGLQHNIIQVYIQVRSLVEAQNLEANAVTNESQALGYIEQALVDLESSFADLEGYRKLTTGLREREE